ncbi:MAG: hypothetical protein AAFW84_09630 [Cyanobacteria bacterium J06635_15]
MLRLWVVCFVLLFGCAEGYQWVSQLHWFSEVSLSLPLVIAGGMALAIASNHTHFLGLAVKGMRDRTFQPDLSTASPSAADNAKTSPSAMQIIKPLSFQINRLQPKPASISFNILRPKSQRSDPESK